MSAEITVAVEVTNPGQYFACCGLLELAHRIRPGAEGWFEHGLFCLTGAGDGTELMAALRGCIIANTMTEAQVRRREELKAMGQKALKADSSLKEEKEDLDGLWRKSAVIFGAPFELRVDWFQDQRSGGKRLKTWAGKQSTIDTVTELRSLIPEPCGAEWFRPISDRPSQCRYISIPISAARAWTWTLDSASTLLRKQVCALVCGQPLNCSGLWGCSGSAPESREKDLNMEFGRLPRGLSWLRWRAAAHCDWRREPFAFGCCTGMTTTRVFCPVYRFEEPMMTIDMNLWVQDDGPAALTIREHLTPVEGPDGVIFPATFAASEDKTFKGGYNIDTFPDGTNICLVDSVGSQANRIEPMFMKGEYAALVPQITIVAGRKINLLEAGHRAGDAIVRCSALQGDLQQAFKSAGKGNCEPLAKIAPTSLVFGAWDSRDTQTKLPRLIASTIRAYNVKPLSRSAQYIPAAEYVSDGLLADPAGDKKLQDEYAKRGFVHVPASNAPGGVIAMGGIRRDASLHLAALRTIFAGDEARTLALRRYVLGLAITAFTYAGSGYLRQGCNLVLDADKGREFKAVYADGRREDVTVTHPEALAFAVAAKDAFGVGESKEVPFDAERAKADLSGEGTKKAKAAKK